MESGSVRVDLTLTPRRFIVPATELDVERLKVFRPGDLLPVAIRKPRNAAHWRKFVKLCLFVVDNHPDPRFHDFESVLSFLKYATEHYTPLVTPSGSVITILKSVSHDAMDEGEFAEWAARAKRVVFDVLFPQIDRRGRRGIQRELDAWMDWN